MGDEHHFSAPRQIVSLRKIAPKCWRQPEDSEEAPGHARGADSFRIGLADSAGEIGTIAPEQREIGKSALGRTPIEVVRITNGAGFESLGALAQKNETIGMRVRQRSQQQRINDAKDGSVRADSERERKRSDKGKAGMLS